MVPASDENACVMNWGRTEGVPRFYIFGEDLASAYVLRHQMSTVLEFWARDRRRFGGSEVRTVSSRDNQCRFQTEEHT